MDEGGEETAFGCTSRQKIFVNWTLPYLGGDLVVECGTRVYWEWEDEVGEHYMRARRASLQDLGRVAAGLKWCGRLQG